MLRSELVEAMSNRRDTDVSVEIGKRTHPVDSVEYDSTLDRIVIRTGGRYVNDLVDDMVTLISELDRGVRATDYPLAENEWYEDWLKRVEQAIGLEAGELNTSTT